MMENLPFFIVDVFGEEKYTGNPLAVVNQTSELTTGEMQRIATEMNYSETLFINQTELAKQRADRHYPVRVFTPKQELPYGGHPTLGGAYVIQHYLTSSQREQLTLCYQQHAIQVLNDSSYPSLYWMKGPVATLGNQIPQEEVSSLLGIDQVCMSEQFPCQIVEAGMPFLIVYLRSLAAIKDISLGVQHWQSFVREHHVQKMLLFTSETEEEESDYHTRVFVDLTTGREDPATGSAHCCLGAYLYQYSDSLPKVLNMEQGYEMGRPSKLYITRQNSTDSLKFMVGGKVIPIAKGELL